MVFEVVHLVAVVLTTVVGWDTLRWVYRQVSGCLVHRVFPGAMLCDMRRGLVVAVAVLEWESVWVEEGCLAESLVELLLAPSWGTAIAHG